MTVDTGEAAGVGQIMEPLLSALRALTNTVHSGEGEGEDEGGEETVLVGADQTSVLSGSSDETGWCGSHTVRLPVLSLSLISIISLVSTSRTVTSKSSISPALMWQDS